MQFLSISPCSLFSHLFLLFVNLCLSEWTSLFFCLFPFSLPLVWSCVLSQWLSWSLSVYLSLFGLFSLSLFLIISWPRRTESSSLWSKWNWGLAPENAFSICSSCWLILEQGMGSGGVEQQLAMDLAHSSARGDLAQRVLEPSPPAPTLLPP